VLSVRIGRQYSFLVPLWHYQDFSFRDFGAGVHRFGILTLLDGAGSSRPITGQLRHFGTAGPSKLYGSASRIASTPGASFVRTIDLSW
jgi:hypothetical protein